MVDVLSLYMEFVQVNCFKTKIDRLVIWRFDNTIWYNLDANRLCWPNEMTLKYRTFMTFVCVRTKLKIIKKKNNTMLYGTFIMYHLILNLFDFTITKITNNIVTEHVIDVCTVKTFT